MQLPSNHTLISFSSGVGTEWIFLDKTHSQAFGNWDSEFNFCKDASGKCLIFKIEHNEHVY